MLTPAILKLLLPAACAWAARQERIGLREGVALSALQRADALRIGIAHPGQVRLCAVKTIPFPLHPMLRRAAEKTGMISPGTIGITLRYGIFIRADCWGERRLVVHELAHTLQYERLGGFKPFLQNYLHECLTVGYPFGTLEEEAKRIEHEICGCAGA